MQRGICAEIAAISASPYVLASIMLIEFRVENHRSIRDEQALTMEAASSGESSDRQPRVVDGFGKPLLPAAALYGANASGKSNVLSALAFMRDAVMMSHRLWQPEGGIPREPFAWGAKLTEPSMYEVKFVSAGVRYQYGFVADDQAFVEEWLYAWPGRRKQTWFERDGDSFKFGEHMSGENRVIQEITRSNALFLSAAVQLRHRQLVPVYHWFRSIHSVNVLRRRTRPFVGGIAPESTVLRWLEAQAGREEQRSLLDDDEPSDSRLADFLDLLRAADVGIADVKLASADDAVGVGSPSTRDSRRRILLRHSSSVEDGWLPLEEESQGTQTLFRLGPRLLNVLRDGGVMIVDELESSLHPALARRLLGQFNDPRINAANAQIIFTTHDTHLLGGVLGEPPLRRDQIWLTEKDREGATCLYPLTNYSPRPSENIQRGYLQGRYGAIPFLEDVLVKAPVSDDD